MQCLVKVEAQQLGCCIQIGYSALVANLPVRSISTCQSTMGESLQEEDRCSPSAKLQPATNTVLWQSKQSTAYSFAKRFHCSRFLKAPFPLLVYLASIVII